MITNRQELIDFIAHNLGVDITPYITLKQVGIKNFTCVDLDKLSDGARILNLLNECGLYIFKIDGLGYAIHYESRGADNG